MKAAITLLALLVVSSGYFINESFAEISEYHPFLLEGSGFAVTEESIKISEINLGLSSQQQHGSTIDLIIEDGFITLNDDEFLISNLEGKFLREGRFIRISGDIESTSGLDTSISFFGRLVEESKDASIYGFTGRITTSDDTFKIIYTTKLSTLSQINTTLTVSEESDDLTIHIIEGSSFRGGASTYLGAGNAFEPLNYFSQDRILAEPGATITLVNDDTVPHRIVSGTGGFGQNTNSVDIIICELGETIEIDNNRISAIYKFSGCDFTMDGRVDTGELLPGESVTVTLNDMGFYRILDPDYTWMKITAYIFPSTDSETFVHKSG